MRSSSDFTLFLQHITSVIREQLRALGVEELLALYESFLARAEPWIKYDAGIGLLLTVRGVYHIHPFTHEPRLLYQYHAPLTFVQLFGIIQGIRDGASDAGQFHVRDLEQLIRGLVPGTNYTEIASLQEEQKE